MRKKTNIHPIDAYAGKKLREARKLRHLSQQALGEQLSDSVTFQQIQKYERGTNRISISRMYELCQVLKVSPAFFLPSNGINSDPLVTDAEAAFLDRFRRMPNHTREKFSALVYEYTGE